MNSRETGPYVDSCCHRCNLARKHDFTRGFSFTCCHFLSTSRKTRASSEPSDIKSYITIMISTILSKRCCYCNNRMLVPIARKAFTTTTSAVRSGLASKPNNIVVSRFGNSFPLHSTSTSRPTIRTITTLQQHHHHHNVTPSTLFASTVKLLNGIALATLVWVTIKSHLEDDDDGQQLLTGSSSTDLTTTTLNRHKTKNPLTLVGTMPEGENHHHDHDDDIHHHKEH